jgi:hypothetical protein
MQLTPAYVILSGTFMPSRIFKVQLNYPIGSLIVIWTSHQKDKLTQEGREFAWGNQIDNNGAFR